MKYVYINRYAYIFWDKIIFAVFLAIQTFKLVNLHFCKLKLEIQLRRAKMTLKWPLMTFKWPLDPRQLYHHPGHLKCFKSCQTVEFVTLIVLVLLTKTWFYQFFGEVVHKKNFKIPLRYMYIYIYRYVYIFWSYIVFTVFLSIQTFKFINLQMCKLNLEIQLKRPKMTQNDL